MQKKINYILPILLLFLVAMFIQAYVAVPSNIILINGEEYNYNFDSFLNLKVTSQNNDFINITDDRIKCIKDGETGLNISLFGIVPIKKVSVDVLKGNEVMPCGHTIGVKIKTEGILVVGITPVITSRDDQILPVDGTGIVPGDVIININGKKAESINMLLDEIQQSQGKNIDVEYIHNNQVKKIEIKPVKAIDDNLYHIGLWVRDSTAGIGTLTFYKPDTKDFAALGHGITDIDTGTLLTVEEGSLLKSSVSSITKGLQGEPGELHGDFLEQNELIGSIEKNTTRGIFGKLSEKGIEYINHKSIPIALKSEVKTGPAVILSNIEGDEVKEYQIIIEKLARRNLLGPKSIIITITDKELLDSTGGIVQGMSGSPIIQDGKLIGAVTHVFINQPNKGYGIFVEEMLKQIN